MKITQFRNYDRLGKLHGIQRVYYQEGEWHDVTFENGIRTGLIHLFYPDNKCSSGMRSKTKLYNINKKEEGERIEFYFEGYGRY